jgi:hypothetical protein
LIALFACGLLSCAHSHKSGSPELLRPAVEGFHQRIRWRDYRAAAEFLVPERRAAFKKARKERNDEKDLTITDYQLDDVQLSEDGTTAQVTSHISWIRLPSVTENSDTVVSEFVQRDGAWFLARQDAGPFVQELAGPGPKTLP